ncbi:MAG: 4Fe-4S binding protein, partial [Calditrichaeota bacterium]|nr:4Fe-4S binding protein [Calditrichota bacterium]
NGRGRFLRCVRNVLGKPDESGRRRPEAVPGSDFEILIDNVIEAVGEYADSLQLTTNDEETSILKPLDKWGRTELKGVWVGGDFTSWDRTVAHAIGAGKRAAMSIANSLEGRDYDLDSSLLSRSNAVMVSRFVSNEKSSGYDRLNPVKLDNLNIAYFSPAERNYKKELDPESRGVGFTEVTPDIGIKAVHNEAERCFHCGACDSCGNCHVYCPDGAVLRDAKTRDLSFDLDHCKGCGVCAEECPRSAIEMAK